MSNAQGQRSVELYIPFDHEGNRIKEIVLGPFLFDHDLKWQEGKYKSSLALIVELSGQTEATLRQLRYPDVGRVMAEFMTLIPSHIATDIQNGSIPIPPPVGGGSDIVDEEADDFDGEEAPRSADEEDILGKNHDPATQGVYRSRPGAAGVLNRDFDPKDPYKNLDRGAGAVEPPADEGGGFEGLTG